MNISNIKRLLPLGLFSTMLLVSAPAFSQKGVEENTVVVTGVVTDAALGTPMAGVKVTAYNNALHSAMTREDGSFTIKVPEYVSSLTFALEGCNTTVCALAGRTEGVNVEMFSDAFSEIYSSKTQAGTSVKTQVSGLTDNLSIDNQIQQNMQGSILSIMRSGQLAVGAAYQIDGISSLNINTQPLVVLDGILLDMGYDNTTMHDGYYSNLLANIQVEDIESVEVLKNGYGIYGAKGANGVIIIKTKRNRSMATKIDLNISGNYQLMPNMPEMMNASQYRTYASELLGTTGTNLKTFKFLQSDPDYMYYNMYHQDTDWSEVAYQEAFVQNYNVNVQGGDDIANYNLSVGYAFGDGVLTQSDFSRFSLRLNSDIMLSDKLNLRFDASYSDITRDMRDDGANDDIDNSMISAPGFLSLAKSPFLSPYAFDYFGKVSNYLAEEDDYLYEVLGNDVSLANPLSILENGDGINKNYFGNRLITLAVTPEWKVNRYFSVYEHFTYTLANSDENYYIPLNGTPNFKIEGIGTVENKAAAMNAKQDGFMSNTYAKYARRFKKHDLSVEGGVRYINYTLYQTSMLGYNSGNDKTPNMTSSLKYKKTSGDDSQDISITWWAQGNYNLAEKYYLSASMGVQSSSRFGTNVQSGVKMFGTPWGIFPSVSAAWVASNESWFNVPFIDYMKVNAGFDMTGNDNYNNSASKTYFSPVKILQMSGVAIANIGNNSLQWETTKKFTAGINMVMFGNRVNLAANVFSSKTDNLLSISALSFLTGLDTSWSNGGSLKNFGFDANLGVKIINTNKVKWEAGAGIGHYKNEITALPIDNVDYESYGATVRSRVGSPVGVFYGYRTNGVFSTSEEAINSGLSFVSTTGSKVAFEAGDVIFNDKDDNNIIDENDMEQIGDPNPDFYGRLYTNFNLGHFTLSATMAYSIGGDLYNYQRMLLESGSRFMNQTVAVTNRWTAEGQVTDMPRVEYGDPHGNARFSDRWIEDGSYLKLKNVTLSYNIPIASTYLQGLTVWGAANNLFTITDYLGSDPEFSSSNNILSRGIDRGLVPQTANFSLGLKINL